MEIKSFLQKMLAAFGKHEARPQAGVRFGISWPLLCAISLVLICAVGWAFFMGLMVGRGQNPQTSLENMAGLNSSDTPFVAEEASASPLPDMLEPELEAREAANPPAPAVAPPRNPPKPKPVAQAKPAPQPRPAAPARPANAQRYDYTFQVAALRSQDDAKKMSATLGKNGFRSNVRKDGRVWLVLLSLRGGASEVAAMQKKLASLKMGKPMQLSRKEIEQKTAKRR